MLCFSTEKEEEERTLISKCSFSSVVIDFINAVSEPSFCASCVCISESYSIALRRTLHMLNETESQPASEGVGARPSPPNIAPRNSRTNDLGHAGSVTSAGSVKS